MMFVCKSVAMVIVELVLKYGGGLLLLTVHNNLVLALFLLALLSLYVTAPTH